MQFFIDFHQGPPRTVWQGPRRILDKWPVLKSTPAENKQRGRYVQGGYIFYAGASLAGAGYCRQCRRWPAILPLQLWQGCQVCVKISAQRLPRVAQFYAC